MGILKTLRPAKQYDTGNIHVSRHSFWVYFQIQEGLNSGLLHCHSYNVTSLTQLHIDTVHFTPSTISDMWDRTCPKQTSQQKPAFPMTLSKWSMCFQWHSPNEACVTSDTLQTAVDWSKSHCRDGGKGEEEKHLAIRFNPKLSTALHTAQNEKFRHQCKSSVNCPDSVVWHEAMNLKHFSFTSVWDL